MAEYGEGIVGGEEPFWENIPDLGGYVHDAIPTMDKMLDAYFDNNMEAIIQEWGLLVEDDLLDLERRVNKVTDQVNHVFNRKHDLNDRAKKLEARIAKLEGP